jgi:HAE1 family hydrophobic/amphiphilic exporter-1
MAAARLDFAAADGPRLLRWSAGSVFLADLGRLGALARRRPRGRAARALRLPAVALALLAGAVYLAVRLVLASLVELVGKLLLGAVILCAWLWRRWLGPAVAAVFGWIAAVPLKLTERALEGLKSGYPRAIRWALAHTGWVMALVVAVVAVTWAAARDLGSELLPEVHQGELTFEVALPVGTPLEETDAVLAPVERAILADRESIRALVVTVGFDAETSRRADEGEHSAQLKVLLDHPEPTAGERLGAFFTGRLWQLDNVAAREEAVIRRIRRLLAPVPDLDARVARPVLFSSRTPIEVEVHGDELPRLKEMGERVAAELATMPRLADVETSLKSGATEVQIVYDRERLSRYGLDLRSTAELVRNQVRGFEATRFNLKDRRIPILVRLDQADRETVADVRGLMVNPGGERPIPLAAVARVALGEGPSEVRRVDGRRVALVGANIATGSLGGAVEAIDRRLAGEIAWPDDMSFVIAGQNEEWEASRGSLFLALALSIFLVYVIMAAQFESLLQPLVIMFTIPQAFFGTQVTLWVLGISLSVVVVLGMIMLAGIVDNNAIVLVDYVNTLRARGMGLDEAIVAAGSVRLRPILMTTATTVLGLAPMALGLGDGAEIRTPMAIAVISGLVTSTVLTLVVIPAIYALVERLRARLLGRPEPVSAAARVGRTEASAGPLLADPEAAAP